VTEILPLPRDAGEGRAMKRCVTEILPLPRVAGERAGERGR